MLLEFRLRNFRSFRDETVLSLAASTDKTLAARNVMPTRIRALPGALRAIGVYGANASGKSNLVRAMQIMRGVVVNSARLQPGQSINVQPFRLDPNHEVQPTEFEVTFLRDGTRYQYGYALTPGRITGEWLVVYQKSQPQHWFARTWNERAQRDDYKFGSHLQGDRRVWQKATRQNALFLSTAVQLNSEQLRPIFEWFNGHVHVIENGGVPLSQYTIQHIRDSMEHTVDKFLSAADISITNITVIAQKGVQQGVQVDLATGNVNRLENEAEILVPQFRHSTKKHSVVFNFEDESEGTRKLFALAAPLFEILRNGHVLFVDELDRSLHALLVKSLIEMFQDATVNTGGAQLVFTTHDTSLFSADVLRRDQFWFTEKDQDQASILYPLTDFSPRKNQALEKGYLSGSFGAIPILKRLRG
jgi:uncharacterized protein